MDDTVARYDDAARERWVSEPPKRPGRTAFERDRARVVHSSALRRLGAKTQVVGPGDVDSDFPRTRLTHSLECAQVGRELGATLGCDPNLVETACLAHDLGHPPFGHNGESALNEAAAGIGGFEGNAQSFRLLTRLEAKTISDQGRSAGLNLTRASLDAATKYPWRKSEGVVKFGVYDDDIDVFTWMRVGAPDIRRCLEAQVMDWADDVAYSVHDLEDGVEVGHIKFEELDHPSAWTDVIDTAARVYLPDAAAAEFEVAADELTSLPYWPSRYDGTLESLAALKNLTSQLIGRFCQAAEAATREAYGRAPLTRYVADLVVPRTTRVECALLKAVTAHYVMNREGITVIRTHQREVLLELVASLAASGADAMEPAFASSWRLADDDAARLRVVIDQVASLTDTSALAWHRTRRR
ncbi:MAG TPA: deoxyguanosinetriphosphate triphosphohydrolase [Acidothermaceae bacterium]|jgi:dGTPase